MHTYKLLFEFERSDVCSQSTTISIDSLIEPATLVLADDSSYGEYEYVQERLRELEDVARSQYDDIVGLYDFTSVTCPDGTVVELT